MRDERRALRPCLASCSSVRIAAATWAESSTTLMPCGENALNASLIARARSLSVRAGSPAAVVRLISSTPTTGTACAARAVTS